VRLKQLHSHNLLHLSIDSFGEPDRAHPTLA
jgi:hypothetical protein